MRILLTGADGQLGRHLRHRLEVRHELVAANRQRADLTDPAAVSQLLADTQPDWIINAAAMTAVDNAETETELADQLNHRLPQQLAKWARAHRARLLHYSTDYVFSGDGDTAWQEGDPTAPKSVYGISKQRGEQAVADSGASAYVLRTAWVYSALPGNFLSAILAKAAQGESLRVVDDQIGSPTWAGSLAQASEVLLGHPPDMDAGSQIVHVVDRGAMSWCGFAKEAIGHAVRLGVLDRGVAVEPVGSDQWPQAAPRPRWSVLDPTKYETLTNQSMPSVFEALDACLASWSQWRC